MHIAVVVLALQMLGQEGQEFKLVPDYSGTTRRPCLTKREEERRKEGGERERKGERTHTVHLENFLFAFFPTMSQNI